MQSSAVSQRVGLVETSRVFLKIGAMSYGGPAIVGIMETEIQERRHWISKREFIEGLALVNMLPGPLVTQLPRCLPRVIPRRVGTLDAEGRSIMQDAQAVVLRHHDEIWSRGNLDAVDELYAPDFVGHHPGQDDWVGRDGVKQAVVRVRRTFPDFTESVEDIVAAADKVVTRFTASGTHLGPLGDAPPTGRHVRIAEMAICRVVQGQIAEKWGVIDRLGMFEQLGLSPGLSPRFELLYEITMGAEAVDVGSTPAGHRRIVHVTGGKFEGPRLRGTVLPGGGDWVLERLDGTRALDVRITLKTDDGHLIYAHYPGRFHGPPDVLARILRGDEVAPSEYYFRIAPLFETASDKYAWLNGILGVGIGRRTADAVVYTVYALL